MRFILALLALCGAIVSGLALQVHLSNETQPCSINEHWDCGIVNHSEYAVVAGKVPVALIGILGYATLIALALSRSRRLLFAASLAGCLYALSLTRIEAKILQVWCLYCVLSQAIIASLLVLSAIWLLLPSARARVAA